MKHSLLFFIALLLLVSQKSFAQNVDITWLPGGEITAQYEDSPVGEDVSKLVDKNSNTKFLSFNPSLWIIFKAPDYYIANSYSFVSGNDAAGRDPKRWTLEGSNNGVTWFLLDSRNNVTFEGRKQTKTFTIADNTKAYKYYKLNILAIGSGTTFQLSEWRLIGTKTEAPTEVFADFTSDPPYFTTVPVSFTNASLNAVTYNWTFEGATPSTSTEANPSVIYNRSGSYLITLEVSDGQNSSVKTQTIDVKQYQDWSSFLPPTVVIDNPNSENPGYLKYLNLVQSKGYESIEEFVQTCCLTIAKELYYTPQEANVANVKKITYKFNEGGHLSYKSGSAPNLEIGFNLNYLDDFSKTHSDKVTADEIYGVLCHEVCHCYQGSPKNAGGYSAGTEHFGFTEGTADLARLLTGGFNPKRYPSPGGSWKDGYTTTAFFYQWITNTYNPDFLKDINKTTKTLSTWSMDAVAKNLFKKSVDDLWTEYQNYLTGNTATNDLKKKNIQLNRIDNSHFFVDNLTIGDEINIYSVDGICVVSGKADDTNFHFDINSCQNGVYIVNVCSVDVNYSRKFVK